MKSDYTWIFLSFVNYFRGLLFTVGLILTLWRGYDCLNKYNNLNISNKIGLENNFETILPVIVVCPTYFTAYKLRILNLHGFNNRREYIRSLESNDSNINSEDLFKEMTVELWELIHYIDFTVTSGRKIGKDLLKFKEIR